MLFLFGQKSDFELIAKTGTECPLCHKRDGGLYHATKKATVYLLPVATLKKTYVVGCPHCKEYWDIDQDLGQRLHAQMQEGGKIKDGKDIGAVKDLAPARSESETKNEWFQAAQKGDEGAIKSMLKRSVDVNSRDGYGETALHIAIAEGHTKTARLLIDGKADINARDTTFGKTPLLKAIEAEKPQMALLLLEKRADVNLADKTGWTALARAAEKGQLEVVQALLAHGADVSARTSNGMTPLMHAFVKHHPEIVALLQEIGATQ